MSSTMKYIGSIDLGTTSTRFILYSSDKLVPVKSCNMEYTQIKPQPGWNEHDPIEVLETTKKCFKKVLKEAQVEPSQLECIGITNQRETTIVWDSKTGKPLYNAIVWNDTRTSKLVSQLINKCGGKDALRERCGLPISTYFSGIKLRWMIDHIDNVKKAIHENRCMFGTFDTWLIWNLTEQGNYYY